MNFTRILFGNHNTNQPILCYQVGLLGCKSIKEVHHGKDNGGLDIYSYQVEFENGERLKINDTIQVS